MTETEGFFKGNQSTVLLTWSDILPRENVNRSAVIVCLQMKREDGKKHTWKKMYFILDPIFCIALYISLQCIQGFESHNAAS